MIKLLEVNAYSLPDAARPVRARSRPARILILSCLPAAALGFPLLGACASEEVPPPASADAAEAVRTKMGRRAEQAAADGRLTVAGVDGWLFQANELRFLGLDTFWGEHAARISRAANPAFADPLPAITAFHRDLQARGIDLLVVPVPAKAAVYPDKVFESASSDPPPRVDRPLQSFYDRLREEGVHVLDLTPAFLAARDPRADPVYCRTDTHWSPRGCRIAAEHIADWLQRRPWYQPTGASYPISTERREIRGDLADGAPDPALATETLTFHLVGDSPLPSDEHSPVILMGDSHTLVFQDGRLHGAQAGLADHLAAALGFPLDLQFRNKGSGSTQVRLDLFRRQLKARKAGEDYLAGKKAVVWCFTVREFSESTAGWRPLPLEK